MLTGKNIVVTGAASGIGQRTAELAQAMGATVFSVDRNIPEQRVGHFIEADLGSQKGVNDLIEALPAGIDALANVAGLSGTSGRVATIAVNFFAPRALSLGLASKINQCGSVINVASIAGFGWRANLERAKKALAVSEFPTNIDKFCDDHNIQNETSYPDSKELLLLWTYQASQDPIFKDKNIRINAVSPGPVETPILKQFREVLGDERVNSDINRVGRAGTAHDIAPPILFLASDASRWVNGTNLACDGGLEASVMAEVMEF